VGGISQGSFVVPGQGRNQEFARGTKRGSGEEAEPWWGSWGEAPTSRRQMLIFSYDGGHAPMFSLATPMLLVLIDDFSAGCPVVKYVDDSTLSEVLQPKSYNSSMKTFMESLLAWTVKIDMQLNTSETKEMVLGPLAKTDLPLLTTPIGTIERVCSFK